MVDAEKGTPVRNFLVSTAMTALLFMGCDNATITGNIEMNNQAGSAGEGGSAGDGGSAGEGGAAGEGGGRPIAPPTQCDLRGGTCQLDSIQCAGGYEDGLCDGMPNIRCCLPL